MELPSGSILKYIRTAWNNHWSNVHLAPDPCRQVEVPETMATSSLYLDGVPISIPTAVDEPVTPVDFSGVMLSFVSGLFPVSVFGLLKPM